MLHSDLRLGFPQILESLHLFSDSHFTSARIGEAWGGGGQGEQVSCHRSYSVAQAMGTELFRQ